MHPWGKWGKNFVEYGVAAARAALADAGLAWSDVQFVAGGETIRNGYPGYVAGALDRAGARLVGRAGHELLRRLRVRRAGDQRRARAHPRRPLRRRARGRRRHHAEGLLRAAGGRAPRPIPTGCASACSAPPTRSTSRSTRAGAWRSTARPTATSRKVKVEERRHGLENPNARYRKLVTEEEVLASPMVSDPLRLLEICATSDGGAALVLTSMEYARKHATDPVHDRRRLDGDAALPEHDHRDAELRDRLRRDDPGAARSRSATRSPRAAYEQAGVGPEDVNVAEVYDLSSALELDWYENIGLCPPGDAEKLLNDGVTTLGGRVPVNPSGGLSCFGEAIPAQAIAQVCELTWQLRGQADGRQVAGAKVGVTVNQGLFGHGSSVVVQR